MTKSQLSRLLNWEAMGLSLLIYALVVYHIYQQHFVKVSHQQEYSFSDLPSFADVPVTADIQQIADMHLFGEVPKAPIKEIAKPAAPNPAPVTRLNIKITGVIVGNTPESGIAMFKVDQGRTLVVAVNENIGTTGATLHQVLPGEALIDRNGKIKSIKMVRHAFSLTKLDDESIISLPQPLAESQTPNYIPDTGSPQPTNPPPVRQNKASSPLNANVVVKSPLQRALAQ